MIMVYKNWFMTDLGIDFFFFFSKKWPMLNFSWPFKARWRMLERVARFPGRNLPSWSFVGHTAGATLGGNNIVAKVSEIFKTT